MTIRELREAVAGLVKSYIALYKAKRSLNRAILRALKQEGRDG